MNYNLVEFQGAYGTSAQIPKSVRPEVSFVGRSNVGKSSLSIAFSTARSSLRFPPCRAKPAPSTSSPPRKSTLSTFQGTAMRKWQSEKARWSEMINGYFDQYRYYALVVSLIDIRHPATKLDEQMVNFLTECQLPFMIALTKADKVSKNEASKQKAAIRKQLNLPDSVNMVVCSSEKGTGFDELRKLIEAACK